MDIIEELSLEADMAENLGSADDAKLLLKAIAEIRKQRKALEDANDLCRSAMQIAERDGAETYWAPFRDRLGESLKRQHEVMHGSAA